MGAYDSILVVCHVGVRWPCVSDANVPTQPELDSLPIESTTSRVPYSKVSFDRVDFRLKSVLGIESLREDSTMMPPRSSGRWECISVNVL